MILSLKFARSLGFKHFPRDLANVNEWNIRFDPSNILSSVYTIAYWLTIRLPYGDILHSLTYAGIR